MGNVKGINQRLFTTARSCIQAVSLKRQGEKVVQADPVRAGVIKEGSLDKCYRVRDISTARNTLKARTEQRLAFLSLPLSSPAAASLWPQRSEPISSAPQGAGNCREWVWG